MSKDEYYIEFKQGVTQTEKTSLYMRYVEKGHIPDRLRIWIPTKPNGNFINWDSEFAKVIFKFWGHYSLEPVSLWEISDDMLKEKINPWQDLYKCLNEFNRTGDGPSKVRDLGKKLLESIREWVNLWGDDELNDEALIKHLIALWDQDSQEILGIPLHPIGYWIQDPQEKPLGKSIKPFGPDPTAEDIFSEWFRQYPNCEGFSKFKELKELSFKKVMDDVEWYTAWFCAWKSWEEYHDPNAEGTEEARLNELRKRCYDWEELLKLPEEERHVKLRPAETSKKETKSGSAREIVEG